MGGGATFRFESATAAERAAGELRAAGYKVEPDPNSGALGFAVEFDAADAETDVPVPARSNSALTSTAWIDLSQDSVVSCRRGRLRG